MLKILKLSSKILMFQEIFCSTLLIILLTFLGLGIALICYPLLAYTKAMATFLERIRNTIANEANILQDIYRSLEEKNQ